MSRNILRLCYHMKTNISENYIYKNNNLSKNISEANNDQTVIIDLFLLIKQQEWEKVENKIRNNTDIDVNVRDNSNNYLIQYIVMFNKHNILSLLISKDAKIDIRDNDGRNLLFKPIQYNFVESIKVLLHYNKTLIGMSLLDMEDKVGYTPLHYSVAFGNLEITTLLLDSGANPNLKDKRGITAFHLSIMGKNTNIINLILLPKYKVIPNIRLNNGETAMHLACNLGQIDTITKLLNIDADPNMQDYEIEFTPLIYSVFNHNKSITTILLKKGSDINIQDSIGNTAIHHVLLFKQYDSVSLFFSYKKKEINMNVINVYGDTYLHILLRNYDDTPTINNLVEIFLDGSRIDITNNRGETCLFYLTKLKLWKTYKNIISEKKMDIYQKNIDNKSPIDFIPKKDSEEFMKMVSLSYMNQLIKKQKDSKNKNEFDLKWQTECSKAEHGSKSSLLTPGSLLTNCLNLIEKHIIKTHSSYPSRSKYKINIIESNKIKFGTFTGINIDSLFGLLHLLYTNKNVSSSLSVNFSENKYLVDFYNSKLNINYNFKREYSNFFIAWSYDHLITPTNFVEIFNSSIISPNKRFFICPINIDTPKGSHANYLLYDSKTNEIERFEPYGSYAPIKLSYNNQKLDNEIRALFTLIKKDIVFIEPISFLPKASFQMIDINEKNKYQNIGDPGGFCLVWCIWYMDMRLKHPNIPRDKLVLKTIDYMRRHNISFRNMIRDYSGIVTAFRDKYFDKHNLDINKWINDDYTDYQFDQLTNNIADLISKLPTFVQ